MPSSPRKRTLTIHPLAHPVDPFAVHRESDRSAARFPDSTGHLAWAPGTMPDGGGMMPGGAESLYRQSLARRLKAGDLWARLDMAGGTYVIGGDSATDTCDVYLPAGCEALAEEVRVWGRGLGAEVRDAG